MRRRARGIVRIAASLLALGIFALTGCAGPGTPPEGADTLRIALRSAPLSLDPHLRNEIVTLSTLFHVYEGLVGFDPQGRLRPELARSWENPDDRRWRFDLHPEAAFHDGRPVTAGDVVFSLERALHHPRTNFSSFLVQVARIRAVDDHTVEIATDEPYPVLLNKLALVAVVPADAPPEGEITVPVGSGPYRFVSRDEDDRVILERVEGHRTSSRFRRLEIYSVADEEERLQGLFDGRFDIVQDVTAGQIPRLEKASCCRLLRSRSATTEYLVLDPQVPPFDDSRVREAVEVAIDRMDLIRAEAGGFGEPLSQLAPALVFGHDPAMEPRAADPEAARALLAQAGHPDGVDLVVELREGRTVEELTRQLERAGVRLEARVRPWGEMYDRILSDQVHHYRGGIICTSLDASDVLDHLAHTRSDEDGYGQHNRYGYSNPAVDAIIEQSGEVLDAQLRRSLLAEGLRRVAEDHVFISLYTPNELWGSRRHLEWQPRLDGLILASEIGVAAGEPAPP